MIATKPAQWSLARRQFVVIGGALTVVAILLGVGGSWFVNGVAERTSDRVLAASTRAITEKLGVEKGQITLDMPPGAFGMLEDNARDNVFYSIYIGGKFLTGYRDFPAARAPVPDDDLPHFRYDQFHGQRVRVATELRYLPRLKNPAIIQVAETLDERHALARYMLVGLALLEAALVGFAVILIRPAIRWGLKPVTRVQRELSTRETGRIDLTPLSVQGVPPELAGLVSGFNALLEKLSDSVDQARRFTADASHQMRTPLAVLRTHIDVLIHHDVADLDMRQSLHDIDVAADRLQRLITQLLALARAEEGLGTVTRASVNATAVASEICRTFAPRAAAAGLELHFEAPAQCMVQFEPLLFEELLYNLLDNSVRYHGIGSYITVRVIAGPPAELVVEDDGQGIPPDKLDEMVGRFSRLARDQEKPGSGLGLSIAAAICASMGAELTLRMKTDPRRFLVTVRFGGTI
ncbi:MAG: sensor histidine kinase [Sphingomonas sp.]